jgi:hypothetical protein
VLDAVRFADHVEAALAREDGVPVARLLGELHAVVSEQRVNAVGHHSQKLFQELAGSGSGSLFIEPGHGELGCAVNGHEQVELALAGPDLGDVHVEVANGVALELPLGGLVALQVRQPRDAVALKAAMQG